MEPATEYEKNPFNFNADIASFTHTRTLNYPPVLVNDLTKVNLLTPTEKKIKSIDQEYLKLYQMDWRLVRLRKIHRFSYALWGVGWVATVTFVLIFLDSDSSGKPLSDILMISMFFSCLLVAIGAGIVETKLMKRIRLLNGEMEEMKKQSFKILTECISF